jgi:hypothetical protein
MSHRARRRRISRVIPLLLILAVVALVTERFRGQHSLKRWKDQMTAKGGDLMSVVCGLPRTLNCFRLLHALARLINSGLECENLAIEHPAQVPEEQPGGLTTKTIKEMQHARKLM